MIVLPSSPSSLPVSAVFATLTFDAPAVATAAKQLTADVAVETQESLFDPNQNHRFNPIRG